MNTETELQSILRHCRTVAVVGLSPKAHRDSYRVAQYMQAQGWRIIPVNPSAAASEMPILGEKVHASLTEAAQHEKIDLVNVFRNSEDVPPVAQEAIAIGARALWLQLGILHEAAAAQARAAGMWVVQDLCLKVEHARQV
jgi:predicted CoA-binding protein